MRLVTCMMPTCNRRAFVPRAIAYFLRQDYPQKELIVVDDGTDPVGDLMPADERVRYVRLNRRASVGAKRNLAAEHARGDIIAHWDDDDWHAPHRLAYQVEALQRAEVDVCGINHLLFYDVRTRLAWEYVYPPDQRFWLNGSTLCYRRAFWASHHFPDLDVAEDAHFVWSGSPERMRALPDSAFHVGIIHESNVAPKRTGDPYWRSYPVEDVRRIMGADWMYYQTDAGQTDAGQTGAGQRDAPAAGPPLAVGAGGSITGAPIATPRPRSTVEVRPMGNIAVVVTCHEPYLKWLPAAMASIDRQVPAPVERVVAFDRCRPPWPDGGAWRWVEGSWGHPAGGRNAGAAATTAAWLIFWDADNLMPDGYLAAMERAIAAASSDTAIIYPDIAVCDPELRQQARWTMPDWDYWGLRAENCVDTAAGWRREALELAGGWSMRTGGSFEDFALALDVTALGWRAARLSGPPIAMRVHADGRMQQRWRDGGALTDLWRARSMAIVTLLAGREDAFDRWLGFLRRAELPPRAALYVVDNSGDERFARMAFAACGELARDRGLTHLDFASSGEPYRPTLGEPYFVKERHRHVARLYASLLPRVTEDLLLTLEDDVEPPPDALRRLGEEIGMPSRQKVGAVAGAYALPQDERYVCAGRGDRDWGPAMAWDQLADGAVDVGFVGGGCTVWANWALRATPVHFWWNLGLGWDAALCRELRRQGYHVKLHGAIRCQHHLHGRVAVGGLHEAAPVVR